MFGELIIMIVYLPILTLTGIEGKMFYPMAFTVVVALLAAMVLSLTFVPAAIAIFLKSAYSEQDNVFIRTFRKWYEPLLQYARAQDRHQRRIPLRTFARRHPPAPIAFANE